MLDRIPCIPGAPVVGSLASILRAPLALMERARDVGDVTRIDVLGHDVVLLHHPDEAVEVLRAQHPSFAKGGPFWSSVSDLLGNGLPVSDGELWLRQRRLMQPQFHRQRIADLTALVHRTLAQSLEWNDIESDWREIDIAPRMQHLTMDVVAAAILGSRISRANSVAVGDAFRDVIHGMLWAMMTHGLPWFPGQRRFRESVREVRSHVQRIIDERRRSVDRSSCVLSWMIAATDDENGSPMNDAQLLDETVTLFIAGFETTASGLMWALYLLSQHPEHLTRVREEADEHLQGAVDFTAAARLGYARAVVQESLRLYPPAWLIPRVTLQDTQIREYEIPANTVVAPVVYTAQRHPAVWSHPDAFDPSRFASAGANPRQRQGWFPFGLGPRGCIGQELALLESQIALALIAQRFDLMAVPRALPRPRATILLTPADGVRLRVRTRAAIPAPLARPGTQRLTGRAQAL
jgi:cytochrome P450